MYEQRVHCTVNLYIALDLEKFWQFCEKIPWNVQTFILPMLQRPTLASKT